MLFVTHRTPTLWHFVDELTKPVILRVHISTYLKSLFIANQNEYGVYFSIVRTNKVPFHNVQSCFTICVVRLYIHVTVHRNGFLFKQPTRRTNYPNLFCYKPLCVSDIFSAHHQDFSTVHSALVSFMQVFDDRFQAESGWNQCRMYSKNS